MRRVELLSSAWKAEVLPLNYTPTILLSRVARETLRSVPGIPGDSSETRDRTWTNRVSPATVFETARHASLVSPSLESRPGRTRTSDLRFRKPLLCSTELRVYKWASPGGLEPPACRVETGHSVRFSYRPASGQWRVRTTISRRRGTRTPKAKRRRVYGAIPLPDLDRRPSSRYPAFRVRRGTSATGKARTPDVAVLETAALPSELPPHTLTPCREIRARCPPKRPWQYSNLRLRVCSPPPYQLGYAGMIPRPRRTRPGATTYFRGLSSFQRP